jgi:hypothetical protein
MRDATDLGLCTKLVVDLPFVRTAGTVKAAMAIGRPEWPDLGAG